MDREAGWWTTSGKIGLARVMGVGRQQQPSPLYFGSFYFRGELGSLNCDYICMCVVNKQFELPEFVFNSVYADLSISLTFTGVFVWCV